jgi:amino acid transporter
MSKEAPTLFLRKATGLVREVGPFTAMALGLTHTIGGGINTLMIQGSYANPGANMPLAFAITAIPTIFTAICYTLLSVSMPRTGGDYIYITRAVNPIIGFLSTWGFWFTEVLSLGIICWLDIPLWGQCLQIAGVATNNTAWIDLGTTLATDLTVIFLASFVLLIIFTVTAFLGMRVYGWIVNALLIIPAIGSFATIGLLISTTPANAASLWNKTYGAGTYQGIQAIADANKTNAAYPIAPFSMDATLRGGISAIWAYIGFTASAYIGGEVKNPSRSMIIAIFLSAGLIIVYYIATSALVYHVFGNFIPTYVFVHQNYETELKALLPRVVPPTSLPTFAAALTPGNAALQFFVAITAAIWLMNDIPAFFVVCTRLVFAWSFDRFFPETFAAVDERFHTPYWAVTLTFIGGIFGVLLAWIGEKGLPGGFIAAMDTTMLYQVTVTFACVAAALTPYVRKDLYEKGLKFEIAGLPLLTIAGVIGFMFNFWFWLIAAGWLGMTTGMITQSFWMALGLAIFVGYYIVNTRKGIDVKTIYAEVPPA